MGASTTGPGAAPPAALVPIKAFAEAKLRLAPGLDAAERGDLARRMAATVLAAAEPLPVTVVCDDEEVADWAASHGAQIAWTPGLGLNGAVTAGAAVLAAAGWSRVVVAHADLPLARPGSLARLASLDGEVILVPDRHDGGTNVAVVPPGAGFTFSYGAGSFGRHRAEAARLRLRTAVVRAPELMWDVDLPADLELPSFVDVTWPSAIDPTVSPCT
ncbi:MAG TPA: 2-phospho-L-lactate guanylyltransferase [Acidimicrobiales bacterium]|nr:2-phospho-L-lactate guanylyltransferase [Acidimicrobiales bacterium]